MLPVFVSVVTVRCSSQFVRRARLSNLYSLFETNLDQLTNTNYKFDSDDG